MGFFRAIRSRWGVITMLFVVLVIYLLPIVVLRKDFTAKLKEESVKKIQAMKEREKVLQKKLVQNPKLSVLIAFAFMIVLLGGILADIVFIMKRLESGTWLKQRWAPMKIPWGIRDVFVFFIFLIFVELVLYMIEMMLLGIMHRKITNRDFLIMATTLLRNFIGAIFVISVARGRFSESLESLGISAKRFIHNVAIGIAGYLAMLPPLLLVLFCLATINQLSGHVPAPQQVVEMYLKKSSEPYLLFFTLFVAVAGPVFEEIFFRGFAYQAFRQRYGFWAGAFITTVFFSLFHFNLYASVPIFFLGFFLAYLYEKTGTLAAPIAAHVTHNLLMVGLTLGYKAMVT